MKIVTDIFGENSAPPLSLSIGMFDGVHRGHQQIISDVISVAAKENLKSGILTFWPHPRIYFNPDDPLKMLSTLDEKKELLAEFGVENLFIQKFNEDFKNLEAEDFVEDILVKKLNVRHLVIGYDHTFGKNKRGNFDLLQKMSSQFDFTVEQANALALDGKTISSTKIRHLLEEGKIEDANEMLGYEYQLEGKVIKGKQIGRKLGYPTANLEIADYKLLPKEGAYVVSVFCENKSYAGMLSIGRNPTFGENPVTVEVFILDFDEEIYGKNLQISFHKFLHEQIPFESVEKLIIQLDRDKEQTIKYFAENFSK